MFDLSMAIKKLALLADCYVFVWYPSLYHKMGQSTVGNCYCYRRRSIIWGWRSTIRLALNLTERQTRKVRDLAEMRVRGDTTCNHPEVASKLDALEEKLKRKFIRATTAAAAPRKHEHHNSLPSRSPSPSPPNPLLLCTMKRRRRRCRWPLGQLAVGLGGQECCKGGGDAEEHAMVDDVSIDGESCVMF
jgi:hypothetical protein